MTNVELGVERWQDVNSTVSTILSFLKLKSSKDKLSRGWYYMSVSKLRGQRVAHRGGAHWPQLRETMQLKLSVVQLAS